MTIQVELRSVWIGKKTGYVWDVLLNGEEIVHHSDDPEHAAARALVKLGHAGPFQTLRKGVVAMTFPDIEETAKWSRIETKHGNPTFRLARWKPFPTGTVKPRTATED